MCCANERNIVGPRFDDRETIEMLALVGSEVWPVSNFIQHLPTSRNNTQHGVQTLATCWAQQCCERLHGPLKNNCTALERHWQKWQNWKLVAKSRTRVYFAQQVAATLQHWDLLRAKLSENIARITWPLWKFCIWGHQLPIAVTSEEKLDE